jgi:hypothetical protein
MLDVLTNKISQLAIWATRNFDEKHKHPPKGFISNLLLLPMLLQTLRLSAVCILTFLAISLTAISSVYINLKELKK